MKKHFILVLVISLIGIFFGADSILAGFGISPPFIKNNYLTPGSRIEETIYLVRGQPTEGLTAEVTIDASEIENWITIEKGLIFPLPKDVQQFPMKVIINVPQDAAYGNYQGYIRVRAVPSESHPGQVATLVGARIDIDVTVTEKGYTDFRVKGNPLIPDVEKGNPLTMLIMIENIGNTQVRPSKVHLDIYDISHLNLLVSGDINEMNSVLPFETAQVQGQMPIDLELGEYWADITVYKEEESAGFYRIYFKVIPRIEKTIETSKGGGILPLISSFFRNRLVWTGIVILIILLLLSRSIKGKKIIPEEVKTPTIAKKRKKKTEKSSQSFPQ